MPIARREMLILARSARTYRGRLATGIMTLVGGIAFAVIYSQTGLRSAAPFIGVVGYMLSLMCIFTGAQLSADAIAREKREGTLGLLFLTGLPAWQITGGKLIANGVSSFFSIFVTFPLLSLLLIVGGVQPAEVFQLALALMNLLFLSSSIGMFVSTISLEQKRAVGRASLLVVLFWWGFPALARLNSVLGGPPWLSGLLLLCSLNSSFIPSMLGPGLGVSNTPWLNLLCLHLLGWTFLGLATVLVRKQWQDKPERKRFSPREWWKRLSFGSAKVRKRLRAQLLEPNPFVWLASRDRLRFLGVWLITFVMIGVSATIYYSAPNLPGALLGFSVVMTFIHQFMAIGLGAAQLNAEQEQGTLEMLLSTPLSARDLAQGQFRASVRQLRAPVVVVLLVFILTGLVTWQAGAGALMKAAWFLAVGFYLFNLYTAIWLAMWGAVIARDPRIASGAAMGRLFGLPLFVTATATILLAAANLLLNVNLYPTPTLILTSICLLVFVNNIYWLRRIHRELPTRLRLYAYARYAPEAEETGVFARLGRIAGKYYGERRKQRGM
jgi:ABC-type transport system involved in multi-copper enzyme maturation permease subunit